MDLELRALATAGLHRLCCSPMITQPDGRMQRGTPPAYGSADCLCHELDWTYHGPNGTERINP